MRVVSFQSWVGGGRRKRKLRFVQTLLLLFLRNSSEIHGTIWIIGGWLRNFLWHYSVYLCNWSSHMHQHSVVMAYLYCVSFYCAGNMLLPRYPWYIDSQHNIITPSIHSQISFLSTHPHWLRSKLFPNTRIITFQQTPIQFMFMEPQVPWLLWMQNCHFWCWMLVALFAFYNSEHNCLKWPGLNME